MGNGLSQVIFPHTNCRRMLSGSSFCKNCLAASLEADRSLEETDTADTDAI